MKKLIITGFLSIIVLSASLAQESVTTGSAGTTTTTAPSAPLSAVAGTSAAAPQDAAEESPALMFGLKFSPSYNWLSIDRPGYESDGGYLGYIYGIMTDFRISNTNYYFATGLEVSARGGKLKSGQIVLGQNLNGQDVVAAGSIIQRMQYLDLPIALKLKTKEIGYSKYYGSFGVMPGFLIKANRDIDYNDSNIEDSNKGGNMSDFGFFNFGITLGAGMEYKFSGNSVVNLGLTYHNSFVDVWSAKNATLNSNYVSLNLGIFF